MSEFRVKTSRIDHIFISHLHGDHIFGLPGFLNSQNLNNRERVLKIVGPVGIKKFILGVQNTTGAVFKFEIEFIELEGQEPRNLGLFEELDVLAFPLTHRIPTFGYRFFEVNRPLNIDTEAIKKYSISIEEIKQIKLGGAIVREGKEISNTELTTIRSDLRSFSYCSDTIYDPSILPHISNSNLLYHEATYTHDLAEKARERMHSTSQEAAMIAKEGGIGQLIIGHYSSRYKDLNVLLEDAKKVFDNTALALEGKTFSIK